MSFFNQFHAKIDSGDISAAIALIETASLSDDKNKYALAMTMLALGRTGTGYKYLQDAANSTKDERAIIEAMASLCVKLGRLTEGVYYAKLAMTMEEQQIKGLPRMVGSFANNLAVVEDSFLTLNAVRALREGKWEDARDAYENMVIIDETDQAAWIGLTQTSLASANPISAAKAARVVAQSAATQQQLELACHAFLAANDMDAFDEEMLGKLEDDQFEALQHILFQQQELSALIKNPKRPDGIDPLIDEFHKFMAKPERLELRAAVADFNKVKPYPLRIVLLTDYSQTNLSASVLFSLLMELRRTKTTCVVLNEVLGDDHYTGYYDNGFEDWRNIGKLDEITLRHMIDNCRPHLILDLRGRAHSLSRNISLGVRDVPVVHFWKDLFGPTDFYGNFADKLKITLPPLSLSTVRRFQTVRDERAILLPADAFLLKAGFYDQLKQNLGPEYRFYLNANNDHQRLADMVNHTSDDQNLLSLLPDDVKNPRPVICDIWGQEHYFLAHLRNNQIPDLLALSGGQSKDGLFQGSYLVALYYRLGLGARIAWSYDELKNMPPLDAGLEAPLLQAIENAHKPDHLSLLGISQAVYLNQFAFGDIKSLGKDAPELIIDET